MTFVHFQEQELAEASGRYCNPNVKWHTLLLGRRREGFYCHQARVRVVRSLRGVRSKSQLDKFIAF